LTWIAASRAWLFLIVLVAIFEGWARAVYGFSFILNPSNLTSITVFAVAPLLLALGQTLVIISGGIDLSVGFTMGLAAVVSALLVRLADDPLGAAPALIVAVIGGMLISVVPGIINGLLIARLGIPPFIGTLGMYGVARGVSFLLAGGTTVPVSNPALAAV